MASGPLRVAVVGSINVDHVIRAPTLPGPGETVLGGSYEIHHGGKGANLAVAASRLGASVSMVGAVGADDAATAAIEALVVAGIDTSDVARLCGEATGAALIVVDESGENQIAVARGANWQLDAADVARALERINPTAVASVLEVPIDAVQAAAAFTLHRHVPFVLSAAPAVRLPDELLAARPVICVNAAELPLTVTASAGDPHADAQQLLQYGATAVLVTLGAAGAELMTEAGVTHFAGTPIADVVDTTGAGDTFAGAMAAFLSAGEDLNGAARLANAAAALSVRRKGAREGMPTLDELERFLAPS